MRWWPTSQAVRVQFISFGEVLLRHLTTTSRPTAAQCGPQEQPIPFGYETFGNKPITLTAGANTITPTTLGTFNVQIQSGCSATATSGSSCLVTNSPVQLGQGISVITTTGAVTGGFTVTLNTTAYILNKPSALSMSVDSTTSGKIDATLTGSSELLSSRYPVAVVHPPIRSME